LKMSKHRIGVVAGNGVQSEEDNIADVNDNWEVGPSYGVLEGGGGKGGRGSKNREASLTAQCLICTGAAAAHQHYGAVCCYSCRAFFRRGITRNYSCVRGDNMCQVNSITRTNCKRCRYARCLAVGMKPELVDATLKRKQEEKRRQELIDIQHEMGIQTVGDQTSQAVTGMMQLQQGGVSASHAMQQLQAQHIQQQAHVLQAVQGLQTPLPRHLVQQEVTTDTPAPAPVLDRSDESLLYQLSQALEGRKKVLLELRNGEDQEPQKQMSADVMDADIMDGQQPIPEYVQVEDPPRAHQVNQPLRQQTYYIFHPLTQTFEPITIAEFEENAVIEEVVVAEDYSIAKQDNDDNSNTVASEHDYIELVNDNGPQIKRPRLSYEEKPNLNLVNVGEGQYFNQEGFYEEVERKPVIAPIVKERKSRSGSTEIKTIKIEKPDSEKANYTSVIKRLTPELIEETVRNHKSKLESEASHVVDEALETVSVLTDLGKVIEETIGKDGVSTEDKIEGGTRALAQVPSEKTDDGKTVDIEELVDVCFEEELQKTVVEEESIVEEEIITEAAPVEIVESKKPTSQKLTQRLRKVTGSKKRRQSGSLLPLKKRRTHFAQTVSLTSHTVPCMGFTREEQVRLTDMAERVEVIEENSYRMFCGDVCRVEKGLFELGNNHVRMRELYSSLILDGFEEFGEIERNFVFRRIYDSWPAVVLARKSSKIHFGPKGVSLMKMFPFDEPEDMFAEVVESVRKYLGGDSKLCGLFLLLLITTQDSIPCQPQPQEMSRLSGHLSLLLFRYLQSRMQSSKEAATRVHALLGCLGTMHRCGNIYMNKVIV